MEGGADRKEAAEELRNLWEWSCHKPSLFPSQSQPQRNSRRQVDFIIYVPESYIMYLSDFCRFFYVPVGGRGGGIGGLEKGGGVPERGG